MAIEAVHTCWCLAAKSCILTVQTVMVANSTVGTVYKPCLPAGAYKVVKKNGTSSLAKRSTRKSLGT